MLEIIREQDSNISATSAQVVGTASALTVMLNTRKLEALARVELGRLVGALVRMISRSLGQTVCWQAGLESLRCVFSSVGSVVVAGSLVTSVMADYTNLVSLLERMMEAVAQHAAHLLAPIISGLLGEAGGESEELEDSVRVGRLAVLAGAAEHGPAGAEGDPSPLYSALS